jgi:ABC-type branched-subunit amino acid transport system substrate-binding protein
MRVSSALVLMVFAVTVAGCGGDLSSQAGLTSRYPQCLQKSQELYDYLRTGVDHSAGHTMDLGMADRRADILYAPPDAQDGLMRAEAQRGILDCEKAVSEGRVPLLAPSTNLPVGPGVTASTITLGLLTDFTGSFKGLGKSISQGTELFWEDQNKAGGVCARKVDLMVKDHGYNVQNAVGLYTQIKDRVLAFQQLLGSPETAALLNKIAIDGVLTQPVAWSSLLLSNPYVVMSGTTYDLEMINAVDWLMKHKGMKAGDKLGHIYLEGEYGENALAGSREAAGANGLGLVEGKVLPSQTDMSGPMQAMKAAGARYVLMTTTPTQLASAAAFVSATNADMTVVGSNPTFLPALLDAPASRTALEQRFFVVASNASFSSTATMPTRVRVEYQAAHPGEVYNSGVMYGYGQGEIMFKVLDAACVAGSLTRPALLQAFQKLSSVDTKGLIAPLDYSRPGQPPARAVYVMQPDHLQPGGLKVVEDLFSSFEAQAFRRT